MNNPNALSFLETTFRAIYPQDFECRQQAEARLAQLAMPHWALGDLLDLAVDLAGMTRTLAPPVARKKVVVMVGDHGVAAEGVSQYPPEVTTQMVHTFLRGGAAINVLARRAGAEVLVVDVGAREDFSELARQGKLIAKKIGRGTANMVYGPAMTRTHDQLVMGASPRASRALFRAARAWAAMAGRSFVTPDDIQALIHPVLAHRLLLTNEARLSGVTADGVLDQIAAQLPVPPAAGDEFHGA